MKFSNAYLVVVLFVVVVGYQACSPTFTSLPGVGDANFSSNTELTPGEGGDLDDSPDQSETPDQTENPDTDTPDPDTPDQGDVTPVIPSDPGDLEDPDLVMPKGYKLFFRDEFVDRFNGAPNPNSWDYEVTYQRNNEDQCYTDNRRENVRVEHRNFEGATNGYLVLEARKENWVCPQNNNKLHSYTSGSIISRKRNWGQTLIDFPHGKYQVRAKIPKYRGTWPAIWLLGKGELGGWPNSGEIDIMEALGWEIERGVYRLHSTLHRNKDFGWPNGWGGTGQGMHMDLDRPPSDEFHLWEMEWTENSISFSVDGKQMNQMYLSDGVYKTVNNFYRYDFAGGDTPLGWPFSREADTSFHMILNLTIGGSWGGQDGIDAAAFDRGAVEYLVDYVRVFVKEN